MADTESSLRLPIARGLAGRCPRSGQRGLYPGFLTLKPRGHQCGLDYSFVDAAGGPAVFVIFISGFIIVFSSLVVEFVYQPPYWLHAVLWPPLILITTLLPLRPVT